MTKYRKYLQISDTAPDRKSTRLNSSHHGISYAVFCLKKIAFGHQRQRAGMLQSWIESTVGFCIRYSRIVISAGLILAAVAAVYAGRHFAINTDINDLISAQLPWRQHEIDFQRAFPQTVELIIAYVHASTHEAEKAAARELEKPLADKPSLFHSVTDQFDSPFFRRNGLLYLPPERIEHFTEPLAKAKPLIAGLVTDPSLRGLLPVLGQLLLSTQQDLVPFDDLQRPLNAGAATLEDLAKGQPAEFSWRGLDRKSTRL